MKKLWDKGNGNLNRVKLNKVIEAFETKDDLLVDQKLLKFDVYASAAHAKMLNKIGIISKGELSLILKGLNEILDLAKKGKFSLQDGDEDIHTKIENFLTKKYGEAGQKIHTGRSRNDQVLTALRLYSKEKLLLIWEDLLTLLESFNTFAKKYEFILMPGYTHMQKAMPSSVGLWASSFSEALLDDLELLKAVYVLINKSPLGSAAGYGVPLNIDRKYTALLLGFDALQTNPLYAQNSRGKLEAAVIACLNLSLLDINKFASDVALFTTSEFGFFKVSDNLSSGSSIMPQKKNIDIAELLRSKIHITLGFYTQLVSLSSNLPSGYNRDLQDTKKPFIEALEIAEDCLKVTNILINNLEPDEKKLEEGLTPEIFATHKALELVSVGMPFRKAYKKVGSNISNIKFANKKDYLKKSTHLGGTGNLSLDKYNSQLGKEKLVFKKENSKFLSLEKIINEN